MNKDFFINQVDSNIPFDFFDTQKHIKFGIDPTSTHLHLGHLYLLHKLKLLLQEGHLVTIVLGTHTASIGDPSGKDSTRPCLNKELVLQNAKVIHDLVVKILQPYHVNILYNHTIYKDSNSLDILLESSKLITINQLLQRPDFKARLESNTSISTLELLYPIFQALDSVFLNSDLEIGGSDQLFNIQLGSKLKESKNLTSQKYITFKVLEGIDSTDRKMSKSYSNTINVSDDPFDIFQKVIKMPDTKINNFTWLFNEFTEDAYQDKINLAYKIIEFIHGEISLKSFKTSENKSVKQIIIKLLPEELKGIPLYKLVDLIDQLYLPPSVKFKELIKQNQVKDKTGLPVNFNSLITEDIKIFVGKRYILTFKSIDYETKN